MEKAAGIEDQYLQFQVYLLYKTLEIHNLDNNIV